MTCESESWFQQFLSLVSDGVDCQVSGSVHYKCAEMVSGINSIEHWTVTERSICGGDDYKYPCLCPESNSKLSNR
jgi:hypothetical protein